MSELIDRPPLSPVPTLHPTACTHPIRWRTVAASLLCAAALAGCSTSAPRMAVVDFGPGTTATTATAANRMVALPSVLLSDVEAASAFESTAVLYRLGYADARQLRPYSQTRWSMSPAQLLRQRLRGLLGQHRSVLAPTDAVLPGTLALRVELEEFSQLFDSAQSSVGLVRVRATLSRTGSPPKPVAQSSFVVQRPASSADAHGGVQALAHASDAVVEQIDQWLQQVVGAEGTGQ
jgi:cholesterol transport system auxiliary component